MKRNNINWIFNNHSIERFFERTALNVTKKQIAKAITNDQITYFKRINVTRSLAYIHANKEVIKVVIHRRKRKIITILPWNSIYQYVIELKIVKYDNKIFKVNLFPDCFLETKKPNALTKIFEKNNKDQYFNQINYTEIKHDHPLFEPIFRIAWDYFKKTNEDHINIQKRSKEGNETFETKGKTEKVKSVITYQTYEGIEGIYEISGKK
jgi:hypothetical protein